MSPKDTYLRPKLGSGEDSWLDNVVFFTSNGIDRVDLHQFGAYTERFGISLFFIDRTSGEAGFQQGRIFDP